MICYGVKELWTDLEGREVYPLLKFKEFLGKLSDDSGDCITFNFSGIEQVTDLVLHTLSTSLNDKTASNVKKIELSGCQHVTDYGVCLLSQAFRSLEKVILDGCKNITERSVFHLKSGCPQLYELSVIATDVGHVPLPLGDTQVHLDGCPFYTGIRSDKLENAPSVDVNDQKVVIFANSTLTFSILDLLQGQAKETTGTVGQCQNCKFSPKVNISGCAANIFQFHTDLTYDFSPFLSSGATYIIACALTTTEQFVKDVQQTYYSIKSCTSDACVVMLICHLGDEAMARKVQDMVQCSINETNSAFENIVNAPLKSDGDFCWQKRQARNIEALPAQAQGRTRLSFLGLNLKTGNINKLLPTDDSVTDSKETAEVSQVAKDLTENELQKEVKACFEHITQSCPWVAGKLSEEVMQFCELLPKDRILTMKDFISKSSGKVYPNKDIGPFRKLLTRLHNIGQLFYCPNINHETVILDIQWFMDILAIPRTEGKWRNGDLISALPEDTPMFTDSALKALYESHCNEGEYTAMINLLKVLRVVFKVPHWPIEGGEKQTLMVFATDLPESPTVRHADPSLEFWDEFWPEKKLPTDAEVSYRYDVHTGVPSHAFSWVSSKIIVRHDVLFLWKDGIIFRDGAVEVLLLKKDLPIPCIEIQARCTRFESGQGKIDVILAEYMWNVLNDVCLIMESVLQSFHQCCYNVVIPCPGECQNGTCHTVFPADLKPDPSHAVTCRKCGETVDKTVVRYISGRKRSLPFHDWRNEKSGYRCSACRTSEGRTMKKWDMECIKLYPNFASQCFKSYKDKDKVGSCLKGNLVTSDPDGHTYTISEHPLSVADFSNVDLFLLDVTGVEFLLVQDPSKFLKNTEDRKKLIHLNLSLDSGILSDSSELLEEGVPFKRGDDLRVTVDRQKEETDDTDTSLFVCEVIKNSLPIHKFLLPEKCHVVIKSVHHHILRQNDPAESSPDEAGTSKAIVSSQNCPVVTSAHFQVGSCLLHRLDDCTTWWGGVIEKIENGYLYVVRTTNEGLASESRKFLPDSEDLAPLCHFPPEADVVLLKDQVKSDDDIFNYLKQNFLIPTPMGLFPKFSRKSDHKPLQLQTIKAKSCVTSIFSPSMLYQSFKTASKPTVLKRQPIGFVLLPVNVKPHHLCHAGRQLIQNWTNQGIGFMCKGEMLAHSTVRIGHLQDGKVTPLTSEELQLFSHDVKSKFWKFLVNSVYYLLQSYTQLTTQAPILSSWLNLLPEVPQDLDHVYISEGLSKLTKWYQHTLILFCALSSSVIHFYPPYFNGKEFGDIVSKITKVMKQELKSNNDFGFCDTHHYLLRAFKVKKDLENPDSLPKLDINLSELGTYTSCIRELKIEEFATDSIPNVVIQCMEKFPNLIRVQLSKCGLSSVQGIEICTSLNTLEVDSNEIEELHEGFETLKHTLQALNLSDNPLRQLPVYITSFSKLNHIAVANTRMTELPEDIGKLTALQILEISKNRIARLPESFRKLKNLESLTFSGIPYLFYAFKKGVVVSKKHFLNWCTQKLNGANSMSTFTLEEKHTIFDSCQKDSSNVLTYKGINQLNNHIFWKLPRLGIAEDSVDDPYGCVPPQIFSCKGLTTLVLSFQGIRFLPDDFNKLTHLRKLIVDHCKMLKTVSAEVGKLPLQVLVLSQCPKLQTPPPEVVQQGMSYTIYYMKKLAAGSQACYRTKLMFVGLGGAGKTSLMRSLMSGDMKSPPIGSEGITDGIDIKSWVINRQNQALTYSVWDFAGQTVYYNTHQFFLTSRAIYFLTWNSRLGFEHAGLEFWLSSIQCHAPKAPVFVVGTHADQVSKSDLPREDLKRNYPSIVGFYSVSSLTGLGIRSLLDDLFDVTLRQPYIGERVPDVWIQMERAIARNRENKCNVMSWEEITDLASNHDLDESEIKRAVKFLHDLGSLQHFDNESLKDKVVINPQWIVDVMACVVSVHNSCIKEGRLKYEDISKIWSEYPADLHDWLLKLTEAFDLTFPLPDQKVNIVPCLLPQATPDLSWPEMLPNDGTRQAKILYRFDILPAGLFNRAQVRLYQISDSSSMWKRGSRLNKNEHVGLMVMKGSSSSIGSGVAAGSVSEVLVKAQGSRPENIIFLVHEVFESLISEFFKGVSYEYLIPCSDCMKSNSNDPTMFSSTILRRAITLKAPFIQCHSSFHSLPISDVQGCMPPEMSDDFDLQFNMTMKELNRMLESFAYDCGIVYCQADVPEEDVDAVHPVTIGKDLEEYGYKCLHYEDMQSLPLNEVLKSLGECKCIIVFISVNFTKNHFCEQIFRYVYDILKKPVLLVTLGQGHAWRHSDIGMKITHKVYINMQRAWQYKEKIGVLEKQISSIVKSGKVQHQCDVFISYSWLNSVKAIEAGHVSRKEGAIGFGDPREITKFLEKNCISCWIDIEKTGVDGLFEDIARGLKQCKVMVACISNEYALSSNCQMEFRFAAVTLKMPIILAVVGNGYSWESTEIGLLSLGHDKSNFQINNNECHEQLLGDIKEKLRRVDKPEEIVNTPGQPQGFRELFELAQRKFMRQFSSFVENGHEYPRLFVVDTAPPPKIYDKTSVKDADLLELEMTDVGQEGEESNKDSTDYFFRILCEHEEGWHACHDGFPVNMIGSELNQLWKMTAPYFGRILKLLKHSNMDLNCFGTLEGDLLIDILENNVGVNVDLKPIYLEIRQHMMRKDVEMTYGELKLCYLPNGKYLWLCSEHQHLPRVTVLENDATQGSASETELTEDLLLEKLSKFDERGMTGKFTRKSKRGGKGARKKKENWKKEEKGTKEGEKEVRKEEEQERENEGEKEESSDVTSLKDKKVEVEKAKSDNVTEDTPDSMDRPDSTVEKQDKEKDVDKSKAVASSDVTMVGRALAGLHLEAHSAAEEATSGDGQGLVRPKTAPGPSRSRPRLHRANSFAGTAPETSRACDIL